MTESPNRRVAILMGSPNDADKMAPAAATLERYGIEADVRVMSAHRSPAEVAEFTRSARDDGYTAIVCGAGHTTLPVIGVPLSGGAINGWDALLATVQMPKGIPVATVAVDGAMNAALLAVQMLAVDDLPLAAELEAHRQEMRPR